MVEAMLRGWRAPVRTRIPVAVWMTVGSDWVVHYCQQCEAAVAMKPREDLAVCPACGASESALRLPLFVVTGASGSGKTTVCPHLAATLRECVVFDVDWLMDSFARASAPGAINWPAFRDAWLSIAHGAAQGGRHTVLLGPFMPEQLAPLPARRWITDVHFAVLDCTDEARRARLAARPPWRQRAIDDHIAFAAYLRTIVPVLIPADGSPAATAELVAEWVRENLPKAKVPAASVELEGTRDAPSSPA
jgi:predicted kinase